MTYNRNSGLGKLISNLLKSIDLNPKIIFQASDDYAISALVSSNFGIAIVAEAPAHNGKPFFPSIDLETQK